MLPFLTMTNHPLDDAAQFERVPPFKSFPSPKQIAALNQVLDELKRACESFPPFASAHEGFAILKEEVDELWDEVKKNPKTRDPQKLLVEAKQVATMAMRFMLDVCGDQINLPSGGRMGQGRRSGQTRRKGQRRSGNRVSSPIGFNRVQITLFRSADGCHKGTVVYEGPERRGPKGGRREVCKPDRRKS